jgi:C1A family cysteine protease
MRVLAAMAALAASANADMHEQFQEFMAKYSRNYKTAEERLKRFEIFVANMEDAAKLAKNDPLAKHGHLTPFADWTIQEFAGLNRLKVTKATLEKHAAKAITVESSGLATPSSFDWRDQGAVVGVKDQAQCGSCWAFSTVANLEGQNFLQNGQLISLSEQELVDCDSDDSGCNGGLPTNAFQDMIDNNMGLELESDYSYHAEDGACKAQQSLEKVFVSSYVQISQNEDNIATALMKYGPLSIGINATPMQFYMGGISDPSFCNPEALDHGVAIVAFGAEGGKKFWVIKNSWGTGWGEEGYYRIVRGKGACGLNRMVASSVVTKSLPAPNVYV